MKVSQRAPIAERLMSKVAIQPNGCWLWTGALSCVGYSRIGHMGKGRSAHVVSYETFVGAIPAGFEIDHLCRNRACINPSHLEPVTARENLMRSPIAPAHINADKTHCKHGHPFDDANTGHKTTGERFCRECRKAIEARYRARHATA